MNIIIETLVCRKTRQRSWKQYSSTLHQLKRDSLLSIIIAIVFLTSGSTYQIFFTVSYEVAVESEIWYCENVCVMFKVILTKMLQVNL